VERHAILTSRLTIKKAPCFSPSGFSSWRSGFWFDVPVCGGWLIHRLILLGVLSRCGTARRSDVQPSEALLERWRWIELAAVTRQDNDVRFTLEQSRTVRTALGVAFGVGSRPGARNGDLSVVRGVIVGGTMLGRDVRALEAEFSGRDGARPSHHETVYHVSLTLLGTARLSDRAWRSLIERFVGRLGFRDTAYVIVRHEAPTGIRIHLIAARFDAWGRHIVPPKSIRAEQMLTAVWCDGEQGLSQCLP
jgi:hypothetical protein